jgi:hypothetical protein
MRTSSSLIGVPALALVVMGTAGCSSATGDPSAAPGEKVGAAQQAITATTVTITRGGGGVVRDAVIQSGANSPYNYGFNNELQSSKSATPLLSFDVSSIPSGATIQSATLSLYFTTTNGYSVPSGGVSIGVYRITKPWLEGTVTGDNFGPTATVATATGSLAPITPNQWASVDVTSLVAGWVSGQSPNYGVAVKTTSSGTVFWTSSEASGNRPRLVVSYTVDACSSKPCGTGGTCAVANNPAGFTCTCAPGYSGATCGTYHPCAAHACWHGATCTENGGGAYTCTCPTGWKGASCQFPSDGCADNPCQNGGTCNPTSSGKGHTCTCPDGFAGDNCEAADPCIANPVVCQNSGHCQAKETPTGPVSSCYCSEGFRGAPDCSVYSCPCDDISPTWKNTLASVDAFKAIPLREGDFVFRCGLLPAPLDTTQQRVLYASSLYEAVDWNYDWREFWGFFAGKVSDASYCSAVRPNFLWDQSNPPVAGSNYFADNGNGNCSVGPVAMPNSSEMDAACKAQLDAAAQGTPIPDLPLPLLLAASGLLGLGGLARRRFGKKVAS